MSNSLDGVDKGRVLIDQILSMPVRHEEKLIELAKAELTIITLYKQGLTTIKPCRYMTDDDLVH